MSRRTGAVLAFIGMVSCRGASSASSSADTAARAATAAPAAAATVDTAATDAPPPGATVAASSIEYYPAATLAHVGDSLSRTPKTGDVLRSHPTFQTIELRRAASGGLATVAGLLNLAPSEVQAVSTFYSMFFQKPAGDHHVLICVNVSCALRGGDEIVEHVEKRLGCPSGGTTADGRFTWGSTVECLGACGFATPIMVNADVIEGVTAAQVPDIVARYR